MSRIQPVGKIRSFIKRPDEMAVSYSTGKYYPGLKVYAAAFYYPDDKLSSTRLPFVHDMVVPTNIFFKVLTVVEHKRVEGTYGGCDTDVYILEDENKVQYYEQTGHFALNSSDEKIIEAALDKDKEVPTRFTAVPDLYERMVQGIVTLSEEEKKTRSLPWFSTRKLEVKTNEEIHTRLRALTEFVKRFEEEFEKQTQMHIGSKDHRKWPQLKLAVIKESQYDIYLEQYKPVSVELIQLAQRCARFKVDYKKPIRDGYYYRTFGKGRVEKLRMYGRDKGKGSSFYGKMKYCSLPGRRETIAPGSYLGSYYVSDFAASACAYKFNSKTTELMTRLKDVTPFEFAVMLRNEEDSAESYASFMTNLDYENYLMEQERRIWLERSY